MADWESSLEDLQPQHAQALTWFAEHAGQVVSWSEIQEYAEHGARLANQAKGIYKPAYTDYALSVKRTLNGPYNDLDVEERPDGSWLFPYFQENPDPAQRDREATNRGLMKCMEDGVPVGVMIQTKPKPGAEYRVLGLARVIDWQDGHFYLEGFTAAGARPAPAQRSEAAKARARAESQTPPADAFDPNDKEDRREKTIAEIIRRRGQGKFRRALLDAYERRCAISDCDAVEALEAAHITPYLGDAANHATNGLLLRADLHTLFDLGLLAIDPSAMKVVIAPSLQGTAYGELQGKTLSIPADQPLAPSREALKQHLAWSGLGSS